MAVSARSPRATASLEPGIVSSRYAPGTPAIAVLRRGRFAEARWSSAASTFRRERIQLTPLDPHPDAFPVGVPVRCDLRECGVFLPLPQLTHQVDKRVTQCLVALQSAS